MGFIGNVFISAVTTLSLTICLTALKVSFIWTLRVINKPDVSVEIRCLTVGIFVLGPYLFGLLQVLWNVPFLTRVTGPVLPGWKNLLLGGVLSVVEGAAVVVFVMEASPHLPVFIVLPLLNTVLAIPGFLDEILPRKTHQSHSDGQGQEDVGSPGFLHRYSRQCRCVVAIMTSFSPAVVSCVLYFTACVSLIQALCLAITVGCVSVTWIPRLQQKLTKTNVKSQSASRRIHALYIALKIFSVICTLAVYTLLTQTLKIDNFVIEFQEFPEKTDIIVPLALGFASGLLSHVLSYWTAGLCLHVACLYIPYILSTLGSIALCLTYMALHVYHTDELKQFGALPPVLIAASITAVSWAALVFLSLSRIHKRPQILKVPFEDIFFNYSWNSVFFEQFHLLSYRSDNINDSLGQNQQPDSLVFICTTVYREADFEMTRNLQSLQNLSESQKFPNVQFEAHIFMDNGCCGVILNEYAQQLLSLMGKIMSRDVKDCKRFLTPYGIQLRCELRGGLPLFVHLKDPTKVKSKKRWSQVMYMHYVTDYRLKKFSVQRLMNCTCDSSRQCNFTPTLNAEHIVCCQHQEVPALSKKIKPDYNLTENGGFLNKAFQIDDYNILSEINNNAASPHVIDITKNCAAIKEPTKNLDKEVYQEPRPDNPFYGDRTYILATDADVEFHPDSVLQVLNTCNWDSRLGGACGRIHPKGKKSGLIVWHQIFEYAHGLVSCSKIPSSPVLQEPVGNAEESDFWKLKSSQNIIGSVLCAPGCFSLYRISALRQVMEEFSSTTLTPLDVYVKDTGEDRWLTTLLMLNGWKLKYSSLSKNTTFCPDNVSEFMKQRRRWLLSDLANTLIVFQNIFTLVRNNQNFTAIFVLQLLTSLFITLVSPVVSMLAIVLFADYAFGIGIAWTIPTVTALVFLYIIVCVVCNSRSQILLTKVLTAIMGSFFFVVLIGTAVKKFSDNLSFAEQYTSVVLLIYVFYPAIFNLSEVTKLFYGIAYTITFPLLHILLPIYAVSNIVDQSWGTRDSNRAKPPVQDNQHNTQKESSNTGTGMRRLSGVVTTKYGRSPMKAFEDIQHMEEGSQMDKEENLYWNELRQNVLGTDVLLGVGTEEKRTILIRFRRKVLAGWTTLSALLLVVVTLLFMEIPGIPSYAEIYVYVAVGIFGFNLAIQIVGLTADFIDVMFQTLAYKAYGEHQGMWVSQRE